MSVYKVLYKYFLRDAVSYRLPINDTRFSYNNMDARSRAVTRRVSPDTYIYIYFRQVSQFLKSKLFKNVFLLLFMSFQIFHC